MEDEVKHYNKSFKKMAERKGARSIIKGYVRELEITYNKKRDNYNPHFRVLTAVSESHFTDKRYYISQQKWLDLWRDVTGVSEITQVQVQKIRQSNSKELYEMAEYSSKDSDYLINQKVPDVFCKSLRGKQVLVYPGLFKEAKKRLKSEDLDYLKEINPTECIYQIFGSVTK